MADEQVVEQDQKPISGLETKTTLSDGDFVAIDDGVNTYKFTIAQLREYLRVGSLSPGIIYYSQSPLESDNPGALKGWTGEYISDASARYGDFYRWVKRHPELCAAKAVYDAELKEHGQTRYYVVDETPGSVRFPVYSRFIAGIRADGVRGVFKDQMQDFKTVFKFAKSMMLGASVSGAGTIKKGWDGYHGLDNNAQDHVTEMEIRPSADANVRAGDEGYPAHQREYPWIFVYNAVANSSLVDVKVIMDDVLKKLEASNIKAGTGITVNVSDMDVTISADIPQADGETIIATEAGLQAVALQTNLGAVSRQYLTQAEYDALTDAQKQLPVEYCIFKDEAAA